MRHKVNPHVYRRVGGGCMLGRPTDERCCDEQYRCSCGANFGVMTTKLQHFDVFIPEIKTKLEGRAAASMAFRKICAAYRRT